MNDFKDSGISAGAMAVIIVAAIAVLVGFMTLICTAINFAKNRRRTRRLQSLSPVRIITPTECLAAQNRRPVPLSASSAGAASIFRFIPSVPTTPCDSTGSKPQSPKTFCMAPEAPPSYEEAMQMAIDESQRTTTAVYQNDIHTPVMSQNTSLASSAAMPSNNENEADTDNEPTTSYARGNLNNNGQSSAASTHSEIVANTDAAKEETLKSAEIENANTSNETATAPHVSDQAVPSTSGCLVSETQISATAENAKTTKLLKMPKQKSFEDVDL